MLSCVTLDIKKKISPIKYIITCSCSVIHDCCCRRLLLLFLLLLLLLLLLPFWCEKYYVLCRLSNYTKLSNIASVSFFMSNEHRLLQCIQLFSLHWNCILSDYRLPVFKFITFVYKRWLSIYICM